MLCWGNYTISLEQEHQTTGSRNTSSGKGGIAESRGWSRASTQEEGECPGQRQRRVQEGGNEKEHVRCSGELEEFQDGWTQGKRGVGVKNETAEASKGRFLRTL